MCFHHVEVLPFPVGGIAGVVVTLIIGILLLTKFIAHLWTSFKKQKKRKRMLEYSGTRKQLYSRRFDAGKEKGTAWGEQEH